MFGSWRELEGVEVSVGDSQILRLACVNGVSTSLAFEEHVLAYLRDTVPSRHILYHASVPEARR